MIDADFDLVHGVKPHRHLYQFYKSDDDYIRVVTAYLRAGLEKGEACLWLVPTKIGVEQAHAIGEKMVPRFLYFLCSGQIQLLAGEDWYLKQGRFDEAQALSNAERYVNHTLKQGFHCIRATGDLSSIPIRDWELLENYEKKVDPFIKQAPAIALCTYPILDCTLKQTKMVLECHDDVLVGRL